MPVAGANACGYMMVSAMEKLLAHFLFDWLLGLQAGVGARGELLLEFVDSAGRVDVFQLAGIERMTLAANVDANFAATSCAAGDKGVSTTASDRGFLVIGVDAVFHGVAHSLHRWGVTAGIVQLVEPSTLRDEAGFGQGLTLIPLIKSLFSRPVL